MNKESKFWDRIAKRYATQAVGDETAYQKKLSVSREYMDRNSRVLEFACGTGSTAISHAPYVESIHATDISANMLAIAKQKAKEANVGNVSFEQTNLLELDSPAGSWDAILGLSILHLVANKTSEIKRSYELLKPGGVFISSTPCISDMSSWFKYIAPLFRWLPILPSLNVFSKEALKSELEAAGFGVIYDWAPGADKAIFIVAQKPG